MSETPLTLQTLADYWATAKERDTLWPDRFYPSPSAIEINAIGIGLQDIFKRIENLEIAFTSSPDAKKHLREY